MGMSTQICQQLKAINNASKKDKREVVVAPRSKKTVSFLKIMLQKGYIEALTEVFDGRHGKIKVVLNGRLNKARGISPMYSLRSNEIDKFKNNNTPSINSGYLVLTTDKGIMDHIQAKKEGIGGRVLGVFF